MPVMITLVFCLINAPAECKTVPVEETVIGAASCDIRGQQLAIDWLNEHSKYKLDSIRCAIGSQRKLPRES